MLNHFTEPNRTSIAYLINAVCGSADWHIQPVGAGVTSLAWTATTHQHHFIVRAMPIASPKSMTYPAEMAILTKLFAAGQLVPEPIAHSQNHPVPEIKFDWAMTRKMAGAPVGYEYFPPQVARQLGQLLAACHALPVTRGWGWVHVKDNQFTAEQATAQDGACERWNEYPFYPLDGSTLENHVVQQFFPDTIAQLAALAPQLIDMANHGQPALCHSDLHGDHIFVEDGQLTGLIDFGDACILPPAWDFAIVAFYYGWGTLQTVLASYTDDPAQRQNLLQQVYHLGIILDLNKMQKAFHRYPQRLARRNENPFFIQCLNRLEN